MRRDEIRRIAMAQPQLDPREPQKSGSRFEWRDSQTRRLHRRLAARLISQNPIDDYLAAGFALIPIPPRRKGPVFAGWQLEQNAIRGHGNPRSNELIDQNIGLAHRWCRTCAVDIDDYKASTDWLRDRYINLVTLLAAPDAVQIKSGRQNRAKLLYQLPEHVEWLPTIKLDSVGLELRCASGDGRSSVQDVLPPSIHPDTGQAYEWIGDWRRLPILPTSLLRLWESLRHTPSAPKQRPAAGQQVKAGGRNDYLTSLGGSMRRVGMSEESISAALLAQNAETCSPPLERVEVLRIARSMARYQPIQSDGRGIPLANTPVKTPASAPPVTPFLIPAAEAIKNVTKAEELVENFLEKRAYAVLFGPSGAGKTFVALDIALCVAAGRPWAGKKTSQTSVVYLNGEGQRGMGKRIKAWLIHNELLDTEVPFYLTRHSLLLTEQEQIEKLIHEARSVDAKLIVVDTLARNFEGNENDASDMSTFNAHIGHLQAETDAAVLIIHHTGLTTDERARGNNQLKGALDSEFRVVRDGDLIALNATKQKDIELGEPMHFESEIITFDSDDGDELTSLIVKATGKQPYRKGVLFGSMRELLATITTMQNEVRVRLEKSGRSDDPKMSRRQLAERMSELAPDTLKKQLLRLKNGGHVELSRHDVWLKPDDWGTG